MALNFLVTGVKMLAKSLSKKKMKKDAKKFVSGGKEEKRAKISKVMDRESSYGQRTKVKKPVSVSKMMKIDIDKVSKVTPTSAKIDYKAFTEKVDNIVGMTDALAFLTGAQAEQKKDELKLLRQQREEEKKRKKEAKLEKKGGLLGKVGKGVKKIAQDPLEMISKFLTNIALGSLALFLVNNADKIREIFKNIGENLELYSKLLRVTIFAFANGLELAKAGLKLMGRGVKKLLSPISKVFKAIGSKIRGTFKLLGGKFLNIIKNLPGLKQLGQMANTARQGVDAARTGLSTARTAITKGFNKVTGNVLRRGLSKAPSRLILKLFGKDAAKMVAKSGKMFKVLSKGAKAIKIPVLGPIIVAVTSILSGDPIGKTLFRTLGAVFGGMIGGAIGAALGGVGAPFGLLLGEIVGEFIGSFLYDMFNGDEDGTKGMDFLKKKFGELLTGAGNAGKAVMNFAISMLSKAGNFFKDGFGRFVENFPVIDISKLRLIPSGLGFVAKKFGVDDPKYMDGNKVNRIPDLSLLTPFGLPKLLPLLKNSFFPSKDGEEVVPETSVSGGEKEGETDLSSGPGANVKAITSDNGEVIDPLSEEASNVKNEAINMLKGEEVSSNVSAISTKASYEEAPSGTVLITEEPKRSEFSSEAQYQQALIFHMNQKELLNNLYKTKVKASLYKI